MHLYVLYFDAYSVQCYVYGRREWMQSRVIPERRLRRTKAHAHPLVR